MIDLTPLDVRNKRGDFRRGMRGYEPREVDAFLESVAERMDVLVRDVLALRERNQALESRVERQDARESAVQEALVSAQSLREEIRAQTERECDLRLREADQEAERRRSDSERLAQRARDEVERMLEGARGELEELRRSRALFLRAYRSLLQRELDVVELEEGRATPDDLDLDALDIFRGGGGQTTGGQATGGQTTGGQSPGGQSRTSGEPDTISDPDADPLSAPTVPTPPPEAPFSGS